MEGGGPFCCSVLPGCLCCLTNYFISPWEVCGDLVSVFIPRAEEERARFSDFLKTIIRILYVSDLVEFPQQSLRLRELSHFADEETDVHAAAYVSEPGFEFRPNSQAALHSYHPAAVKASSWTDGR